jgi:hypothetical protein
MPFGQPSRTSPSTDQSLQKSPQAKPSVKVALIKKPHPLRWSLCSLQADMHPYVRFKDKHYLGKYKCIIG